MPRLWYTLQRHVNMKKGPTPEHQIYRVCMQHKLTYIAPNVGLGGRMEGEAEIPNDIYAMRMIDHTRGVRWRVVDRRGSGEDVIRDLTPQFIHHGL